MLVMFASDDDLFARCTIDLFTNMIASVKTSIQNNVVADDKLVSFTQCCPDISRLFVEPLIPVIANPTPIRNYSVHALNLQKIIRWLVLRLPR
jgi:hypothetical protein